MKHEYERNVLCPHCGNELRLVDVYDTDTWDNITLTNRCYGRCDFCGKKWNWKEDFVLTEAFDFEENEDN